MENKHQRITQRQGNRIFILETFSAAALFLPQIVLRGNYGSGILSVGVVWILLACYVLIASKVADGIPMEQVLKHHRWAAIIYYIRFWINAAFFYTYIVFMVGRYMLPQNQGFVIGFPLLVLAWRMNRGGLKERGRVMEGIFWFVLLPVIFVLLLSITDLSFKEIAVSDFQWKEFFKGSLLLLALLHPMELVWFYRGNMSNGGMKFRTFFGIGILLIGIFCAVVGSLGRKLTLYDENPVMSMAQGAAIPGGIMARLDIFLIAFWIVGVFCVFSGYLFYGNEGLKHVFFRGRMIGNLLSYGGLFLATNVLFHFWYLIWNFFSCFLYANLTIGLLFPLFLFYMEKIRRRKI